MKTKRSLKLVAIIAFLLIAGSGFSCITYHYSLPIENDVAISVYANSQVHDLSKAQVQTLCTSINQLKVHYRFPMFNFRSVYEDRDVQEIRLSSESSPTHVSIYLFLNGQRSFIVNGPNMSGLQYVIVENDQYRQLMEQLALLIQE